MCLAIVGILAIATGVARTGASADTSLKGCVQEMVEVQMGMRFHKATRVGTKGTSVEHIVQQSIEACKMIAKLGP